MEELKEDIVLEFRALTMTKRTFDQVRKVRGDTIEVLGWVNTETGEYFVGKLGNTLAKVHRMDMIDQIGRQIGLERAGEEAQKLRIGISQYLNIKLDQYRDTLRQIFIK